MNSCRSRSRLIRRWCFLIVRLKFTSTFFRLQQPRHRRRHCSIDFHVQDFRIEFSDEQPNNAIALRCSSCGHSISAEHKSMSLMRIVKMIQTFRLQETVSYSSVRNFLNHRMAKRNQMNRLLHPQAIHRLIMFAAQRSSRESPVQSSLPKD